MSEYQRLTWCWRIATDVFSNEKKKKKKTLKNVSVSNLWLLINATMMMMLLTTIKPPTDALDSKFSEESDELADEDITGPERAYRGPHIVFPLQKKDIDTLIDFFRKKKVCIKSILFLYFVPNFFSSAVCLFASLMACTRAPTPNTCKNECVRCAMRNRTDP